MASVKRYILMHGGLIEAPDGKWALYEDIGAVVKQAYENGKKVGYREGHSDGERNAHAIRDYCPSGDYPGIGG